MNILLCAANCTLTICIRVQCVIFLFYLLASFRLMCFILPTITMQGPVQRWINANPGLKFNPLF
jgi:hypothetical protein